MIRVIAVFIVILFPIVGLAQTYFGGWDYDIFAGTSPAIVADVKAHSDLANEANGYLYNCTFQHGDAVTLCEQNQAEFVTDYIAAFYNDHAAQDNVAAFLTGDGGEYDPDAQAASLGISQNIIQGCAWRAAILGSGGAQVSDEDITKGQAACSSLTSFERQVANERSEVIDNEIQRLIDKGNMPQAIISNIDD